jgi:V/A-type H+-transporting ATPase subunit A
LSVKGSIIRVAGPVVEAEGMSRASMHELVEVGKEHLVGEVIGLRGEVATIQVYQNTSGLRLEEEVIATGRPLSVELGPGLVGNTFDGIQRPLEVLRKRTGPFIKRGITAPALSRQKKWFFTPLAKVGSKVSAGDILGKVDETGLVEHRIMVPPRITGTLEEVAKEGDYGVEEVVAVIRMAEVKVEVSMLQKWPVRVPRPFKQRLLPSMPLITGQRVIDAFFPIAKGGTAAIPGGFGTGKTITQQQLAKWSDANLIVYVGCGERGNEMVDVLSSFPELIDPRSGKPLMERTVLIANTSNMPVSAREASIYTGITIAEYYRDMGYDVALMADSTSRWAEALREISGRLEEMPAEEGFPSYLPSRLAEFYERAGLVETLGSEKRLGSICAIGAVSPPGGDFSEPVTQHTKRYTRVFWALDAELANERHYPAINWIQSYSGYTHDLEAWWSDNADKDWSRLRETAMGILQSEDELKNIVKLVGSEALPEKQRLILETARIIKVGFLQQNALDVIDTYCSPLKQAKMLKIIVTFHELAERTLEKGAPLFKIISLPVLQEIVRMKDAVPNTETGRLDEIESRLQEQLSRLMESVS